MKPDFGLRPDMPRLTAFLCYRRDDERAFAERIHAYLSHADRLGRDGVFQDSDGQLPVGASFPDALRERLASSSVCLVVIGVRWLDRLHERLDQPLDWVCAEIELAFQQGIPVVPVLVGGASMPRREDLPEAIARLADHQSVSVDHNPRFEADMERLLEHLPEVVQRSGLDLCIVPFGPFESRFASALGAAIEEEIARAAPLGPVNVRIGPQHASDAHLVLVLVSGTGRDGEREAFVAQLGPERPFLRLVLPFYSGWGFERAERSALPLREDEFVRELLPRLGQRLLLLRTARRDAATLERAEQRARTLLAPHEERARATYRQHLDLPRRWAGRLGQRFGDATAEPRQRYEAWIAKQVLDLALREAPAVPRELRPRLRLATEPADLQVLCLAPLQVRRNRRPVWLAWCTHDGRADGLAVVKEDVPPEPADRDAPGELTWLRDLQAPDPDDRGAWPVVELLGWGYHDTLETEQARHRWIVTRFAVGGTLQQFSGTWKFIQHPRTPTEPGPLERYLRLVWQAILAPIAAAEQRDSPESPFVDDAMKAFGEQLSTALDFGRYSRWWCPHRPPTPRLDEAERGAEPFIGAVCRIVADVAQGISFLRERDVVHGDLKPANILLDLDGAGRLVVRLCDFDAASRPRDGADTHTASRRNTVGFEAPEFHDRPSWRSDVFSLCVTIACVLTARQRILDAHEVMARLHLWGVQVPRFTFSDVLAELLMQGTARDPRDRPEPETLAEWFRRVAAQPPPTPDDPVPARIRRGEDTDLVRALRERLALAVSKPTLTTLQRHQRQLAGELLDEALAGGDTRRLSRTFGAPKPRVVCFSTLRQQPTRVWIGWDLDEDRLVVVRELWSEEDAGTPGWQLRFRIETEREIFERLRGARCAVQFVAHGHGWLATTYAHGGSMRQRYLLGAGEPGRHPELPDFVGRARDRREMEILLPRLVQVVRELHEHQVIHRALTADQFLLDLRLDLDGALDSPDLAAARVLLVDFSLAHHPEVAASEQILPPSRRPYPSHLGFHPPDPWTDAAAVAGCAIALLTTRPSPLDETPGTALRRDLHRVLVRPAVQDRLLHVLDRAGPLEGRTAAEALEMLQATLEGGVFDQRSWSALRRASRLVRRFMERNVGLLVASLALVVIAAVFAGTVLHIRRDVFIAPSMNYPVYAKGIGPHHPKEVAERRDPLTKLVGAVFDALAPHCPSLPQGDVYVHWTLTVPDGCALEVDGGRTLWFNEDAGIVVERGGGIRLGRAPKQSPEEPPSASCQGDLTPHDFFGWLNASPDRARAALDAGYLVLRPLPPDEEWLGVTILGKGKIQHREGGQYESTAIFEACEPHDHRICRYGSASASSDASVVVAGVYIDRGGHEVVTDHEFNALTLAGVSGIGSRVADVYVDQARDDCVEVFGGDIDIERVWCRDAEDDVIDLDEGYAGTVSRVVAEYTAPKSSEDHLENSEATPPPDRTVVEVSGRFQRPDAPIEHLCVLDPVPTTAIVEFRPDWDHDCFRQWDPPWDARPEEVSPESLRDWLGDRAGECTGQRPLQICVQPSGQPVKVVPQGARIELCR